MTVSFVIGNGISRKSIDLNSLVGQGRVYGCNALYREFTPDVLVATDTPIATQIQESGYAKTNRFYTRRPISQSGALALPTKYAGYSSGPNAVGLSCIDGNHRTYLLGFDMGPLPTNTVNNVYAGTEFYKPVDAHPTFTGNWINQLIKIMSDHRQVQFIRVQGPTTAQIDKFNGIQNLSHVDLCTFTDRINNKKDL